MVEGCVYDKVSLAGTDLDQIGIPSILGDAQIIVALFLFVGN
jgi:hypothetical protein